MLSTQIYNIYCKKTHTNTKKHNTNQPKNTKANKPTPYISTMSRSGASGSIVEKIMTPTVSSFSAFRFPVFHSLRKDQNK